MDATSPVDPFAWWRDALDGRVGPVQDGKPEAGCYRYRNHKGNLVALYLYPDEDGAIIGLWGKDQTVKDWEIDRIWQYACKGPITYEFYRAWFDTGIWPDEPTQGVEIGQNRQYDDLTDIQTEIEELKEIADAFLKQIGGKITTQAHADRAGNLASEFNVLEDKADKARTKARKPHLDAGRKIDADWKPVVSVAEGEKVKLKNLITKFLIIEAKRRKEAAAEAAAAAAAKAAEAGEPPPPPDFTPVKVKAGGASGKSIGLREIKTLSYTDYAVTCAYYAKQEKFWQHPDVLSIVGKLAKKALDAGLDVPGAKLDITEQAV